MKRSPLRRVSKQRAAELRVYSSLRKYFLSQHPYCEWVSDTAAPTCLNASFDVHHSKGRHGELLNDTRWWIPVCREHHTWIEDNKKEARKRGMILYK